MELLLHPQTKRQLKVLERPGAYILYGPKGVGKTTAVKQLYGDKISRLITPEKGSIKVGTIKELNVFLDLKSWNGQGQIIVIDQADKLTHSGQNAMLKNLEELAANVVFVFITDDIDSLLPTVRSRCHHVYCQMPEEVEIQSWINQNYTSDTAEDILSLNLKNPAMIISLAGDEKLRSELKSRRDGIEQLFIGDTYSRLQAAARLQSELPGVLDEIISYVREAVRNESDADVWVEAIEACERADNLQRANVNKRYILDVLALSAGHITTAATGGGV